MVDAAADEGWDRVLIIEDSVTAATTPRDTGRIDGEHGPARRPRVILHVSRFPWG